jgi:lipoate-protein ligase A
MQSVVLSEARLSANLAFDEALLLAAEAGQIGEVLRLWEAPRVGIVLGASGSVTAEVQADALTAGVEIGRRCSGGGTVLVGPGCLCYALVLALDRDPALRTISSSNRWIMTRLAEFLSTPDQMVDFRGTSDLCLGVRKISGNAQRRGRRFLLHHGTVLYDFPLDLLPRYLREPARQPEYRQARNHLDFVTNLPLASTDIRQRLICGWEASTPLATLPWSQADELERVKYGTREWVFRR